ncbi:hypothetical protein [Ornithinibacillus scapharcae]|uniref:hypothetical protein n=1 Tax=Ornithinibacillus scapharcae TaxID=1147159 RepID=UPI000225AB25|nr:hypothetical protein [Ornithinibacillus scapharcae]
MKKTPFLILIGLLFSLTIGCSEENSSQQQNNQNPVNVTKISAKNVYDQEYSNEAKQILSTKEDINNIYAVNTDDLLVIAIEVPHHERFNLKKLNTTLSKEMDKKFKNIKVELATDKKIILELTKLEEKIKNNNISKKELKNNYNT